MLKNLLIYRFVVFNAMMGSLMLWLASKGYIGLVLASDPTGISWGIVALFVLTFGSTLRQLWKVAQQKNEVKDTEALLKECDETSDTSLKIVKDTLVKRALKRIIKLRAIKLSADTMSMLGIIGTVVGFIIAFAVQDPATLVNVDVGDMTATVLGMVKGMSIALYTTLTGAVLGVWTTWNWAMIKDAADILKVDSDVR